MTVSLGVWQSWTPTKKNYQVLREGMEALTNAIAQMGCHNDALGNHDNNNEEGTVNWTHLTRDGSKGSNGRMQ